LTDLDIYRAVRQPQQGQVVRKSSRMLIN